MITTEFILDIIKNEFYHEIDSKSRILIKNSSHQSMLLIVKKPENENTLIFSFSGSEITEEIKISEHSITFGKWLFHKELFINHPYFTHHFLLFLFILFKILSMGGNVIVLFKNEDLIKHLIQSYENHKDKRKLIHKIDTVL